MTLTQAVDTARANKSAAARLPAYEMLAANPVPSETHLMAARRLLLPDQVAVVRSALLSTDMELTLPGEAEQAHLIVDLTALGAILCGGWSPAARAEWQAAVLAELADAPYLLVAPVLRRARREVQYANQLLVWVFDQVTPAWRRIERERALLEQLLEIADAKAPDVGE